MRAYRFKHVLHGQCAVAAGSIRIFGLAAARHDGAAVEDHRRDIQPCRRHRRCGDGLVAADQQHHRVEAVAADRQLDRIGDGLARCQRCAHAVAAHRDAVGHRDGIEFDRRAAVGEDAATRVLGQIAQRDVAGRHVRPGVHHRHEWSGDGGIVQPGGAQHGACRCACGACLDRVAVHVSRIPGNLSKSLWKKSGSPKPDPQKPKTPAPSSGAGVF